MKMISYEDQRLESCHTQHKESQPISRFKLERHNKIYMNVEYPIPFQSNHSEKKRKATLFHVQSKSKIDKQSYETELTTKGLICVTENDHYHNRKSAQLYTFSLLFSNIKMCQIKSNQPPHHKLYKLVQLKVKYFFLNYGCI